MIFYIALILAAYDVLHFPSCFILFDKMITVKLQTKTRAS